MTSDAFRNSMNSLGWSRRDPDLPVTTSASTPLFSKIQSYNPFGRGGYVRLPTHEAPPGAPLPAPSRRAEEEGYFARKLSCLQCHCHGRVGLYALARECDGARIARAICFAGVLFEIGNFCLRVLNLVSRWDRILVFGALNLVALALFVICFTLLPILSLKPRKFTIL